MPVKNYKRLILKERVIKLKNKIDELEFIKEFQRDYIANLENLSGLDLAKDIYLE